MTVFYLGTHRPLWLTFADIPLFISAATLAHYRSTEDQWPTRKAGTFGSGSWAFDSGAFTALSSAGRSRHPWHLDPDSYGGMVARVTEEIGVPPRFAAIQDWPCEPAVRQATGLDVTVHQELTIESYLWLTSEFSFIPWIPVLQGWRPEEYLEHMAMYEAYGIDLSGVGTVGLGSVCRRGSAQPVITVVEMLQAHARARFGRPLPLHGFGLNITALRRIGLLLTSCDSMAWSVTARLERIRLAGCDHQSRWCNNCPRYALLWRARVLAALQQAQQPSGYQRAA